MLIITYIMGHTLTITQETLPMVHSHLRSNYKPTDLAPHTSPRLANRQLKFFFHVLRNQIYEDILKWQQATLHTSGGKNTTWLSTFVVMLAFAMVLEEAQRTMQIQADAKWRKRECSYDEAQQEASNACERIDARFALLIGLFQCKYRDKKWVRGGSFGPQTPRLRNPVEHTFCEQLRELVEENRELKANATSIHQEPPFADTRHQNCTSARAKTCPSPRRPNASTPHAWSLASSCRSWIFPLDETHGSPRMLPSRLERLRESSKRPDGLLTIRLFLSLWIFSLLTSQ
jgi:hypothetical protein